MSKAVRKSLKEVLRELKNTFRALYKLAPLAVVFIALVTLVVIGVVIQSTNLMIGDVLLLVIGIAVIVYLSTANYGEAALALAAGLFSVYSVDWTPGRFVGFIGA